MVKTLENFLKYQGNYFIFLYFEGKKTIKYDLLISFSKFIYFEINFGVKNFGIKKLN